MEFCRWCEVRHLRLPSLSSPPIVEYFQELNERLSPASANLYLAAIRGWLEWLVYRGVLPFSPAAAVRPVRLRRREGKTPVLEREEARRLFIALDGSTDLAALRDRAILAIMLYDFVRVGAVTRMSVRDFGGSRMAGAS